MQRSTIHAVARLAGCSVSTVSRVINHSGPASAEARARVEAAVADLAFRPSALGASLRARRTRAIGVVVPSFTNPVFAASIAGLEAVARSDGRQLLTASTDYDPAREHEVVDAFISQRVEGLALTVADAERSPVLDRLEREGVPFVLLYNQPRGTSRAAVSVDNRAATADLARRLIDLGHRRIAYVAGRLRTTDRSRLRFRGCAAALAGAGLPPPALIELDYLAGPAQHAQALTAIMCARHRPTALLCSNDLLALSVIAALRSLGLDVPRDVSVAGFDGIAIGRMINPTLATIDTPTREMGERGMQRLLGQIAGHAHGGSTVELLPHEFRPGGTLASVPGGKAGSGERRRPKTSR